MSFLSRIFTGGGEERLLDPLWGSGSSVIPSPAEDALLTTGGVIPERGAMALGAFYACVTLLADIIATLSLKAYKPKDNTTALVTPQPALFDPSPFPDVSWFAWLWMMMESLAVTGNAFGHITARGKDGRPSAIMPVHPDLVTINTEKEGADWLNPIYHFNGKRVNSADVVHIKRFPIAGCAWGMSPVQKAASAVGLALAAERYGLRYFRDSANPSGILSTDQELTPDQSKRAMKQWIASHQGRRLPAVMSGGLKWQSVTLTPNESQFLETRSHQRSEIAMWFRIPPHMIGDTEKSTSWGTGIEQQSIGFVTYTLTPWLTCIEQALTAYLPRGNEAKFNIDGLLRGDVKTRWEAYQLGRDAGVYSSNEIREMENLPPIGPEGDIRLQPMNFVPLGTKPEDLQPKPADNNADGADKESNGSGSPDAP